MSSSNKVFIYNSHETDRNSADDLKELFSSNQIFAAKPDVTLSDFNSNFSGLCRPTFVVPGGAAMRMAVNLQPKMQTIQDAIKQHYHYISSCAGAFLGTKNAYVFDNSHGTNENKTAFVDSDYMFSTQDILDPDAYIGDINDYDAIGPFYPDDHYLGKAKKLYMPYRVNLQVTTLDKSLAQLYVSGAGFFRNDHLPKTAEIVATYSPDSSYSFNLPNGKKTFETLPAMIRRFPTEDKGAVFLSGTHIETCVPNSKFLRFFQEPTQHSHALSAAEYNNFCKEQTETRADIELLLRTTLSGNGI